jgi:predicted phosphodiesterase
MRYLILSDIHANLEALETVLQDEPAKTSDRLIVLGDLVGYGADPNAVVERIRAMNPLAIVRGNHDKVAAGLESSEGFNTIARRAAEWTASALTRGNREYLAALPAGPLEVSTDLEICHGAPYDEDAYIVNERYAVRALRFAIRPLCLFGHTHFPLALKGDGDRFQLIGRGPHLDGCIPIAESFKYLVNPGSVGQPRDGDPRAGYGIFDDATREVLLYRVLYPVAQAQAKVIAAGLPEPLAERLMLGR